MRKQALLGLLGLLGMCCSAMAAAVVVNDRPVAADKATVSRTIAEPVEANDDLVAAEGAPGVSPESITVPLDPDMVFKSVVMGADGKVTEVAEADGGSVAGPGEHLIYQNTLGIHLTNFPTNQPVSDDISTVAPDGCNLTRYKFKVLGKVLPAGASGPYTVTYGLYTNCPLAVGSTQAQRDLVKIPGTDGVIAFPDDLPRDIEHVIPFLTPVALPSNVYLSLRYNRGNCGTVVGAPAMIGFSGDIFDFPGFACNSYLGGFPQLPHASFWAEMYGTTNCSPAFAGYKCQRPSGGTATFGANIQGVDDIHLIVDDCAVVGYEVVVKGVGFYTFDLRRNCDGSIVPGSTRTFQVNASTQPLLQVARFTFQPPITLTTDNLFLGFKCSSNSAGAVIAGIQPIIGGNEVDLFTVDLEGCATIIPTQGVHGAVNLSIMCAGSQPIGACCDPHLTECNDGSGTRCICNAMCQGGPENGVCCVSSADCDAPGTCVPVCANGATCEAVCRQTTQLNCPFPPIGQELRPTWQIGEDCVPDPFGADPCGVAACCHMRPNEQNPNILDEVCENMTKNECDAAEPLDRARLWQLGQYCGINAQRCPRNACLARQGSCYVAHATPGCSEPFCCSDVCALGAPGAFCCNVAWDAACVALAEIHCPQAPPNDQCALDVPIRGLDGALAIPVPGSRATLNLRATESPIDFGFCCHNGVGICLGNGPLAGQPCIVDQDCGGDTCTDRTPDPGATGMGSIWFKFTMPLGTCNGGPTPGASCATSAQCRTCVGGANAGLACTAAGDCPGGTCPAGGTCNGGTSAGVSTCTSNSPALDSILQVYRANDNSSSFNACNSLSVVGCADDTENCGSTQRNSRICLRNLTLGGTYYVLVAAKTDNRRGQYIVTISTSCSGGTDAVANDYCHKATAITDPTPADPLVVPFDLGINRCTGGVNAGQPCDEPLDCPNSTCAAGPQPTFDCPAASCSASAQNDIWWNYTATCTGEAIFSTCGAGNPDTNIAVYDGCTTCPTASNTSGFIGCNADNGQQGCVVPGRVVVDVTQGQCYKVRISDQQGFAVAGNLTITCTSGDCQPNGVQDSVEIANCPPGTGPAACQDCNGNGRPDECDIRDGIEQDCQPNGKPDSCELAGNDCQPDGVPDDCVCVDACCGGCPNGSATFVTPPSPTLDAGRPFDPATPGTAQGLTVFTVNAPAGAASTCWSMCERNVAGSPNSIVSAVEAPAGTYTITLNRPITTNSTTTITYTPGAGAPSVGVFTAHPGNVDANGATVPNDIIALIDHLNAVTIVPTLQCDTDRSAVCAPTDLLTLIDMLNGASGFPNQNNSLKPPAVCP